MPLQGHFPFVYAYSCEVFSFVSGNFSLGQGKFPLIQGNPCGFPFVCGVFPCVRVYTLGKFPLEGKFPSEFPFIVGNPTGFPFVKGNSQGISYF